MGWDGILMPLGRRGVLILKTFAATLCWLNVFIILTFELMMMMTSLSLIFIGVIIATGKERKSSIIVGSREERGSTSFVIQI